MDTVIVDEIHALVPTKRGSHLALSLERLQRLCAVPPQRIGLSATQRPLEEVARFLGGAAAPTASEPHQEISVDDEEAPLLELEHEFTDSGPVAVYRPVTIVDTGEKKSLSLVVEVPVEDMQQPVAGEHPQRAGVIDEQRSRRSGPPFIRGCWSWSGRTAPR